MKDIQDAYPAACYRIREEEDGTKEGKRKGWAAEPSGGEKKSRRNRHRNVTATSEKQLNIDNLSPGRRESQSEPAEAKAEACPDVNRVSVCAASSLNMWLIIYSSGGELLLV